MNWTGLLMLIAAGLLVWLGFRMVRGNPQAFSKENISKSFMTVGLLTLLLVVVVAIAVMFLKG